MKPKLKTLLLSASVIVGTHSQALAALIVKTNTTDALNLTASWVGGVQPGTTDTAVWDATVNANQTVSLGGNLTWGGIDMTNAGGDITISAGNTLTLGSGGFTSAAAKWIFVNSAVALGSSQTWTTPNNLYVAGVVSGTAGLTKAGGAILTLSGTNTFVGGTNVTAGQISTRNGAALGPTTNVLTLNNGTQFRYETTNGVSSGTTTFVGNPISVATSSSVTITTNSASNGYSGIITGDGNSTVTIGATGATTQCSFNLGASTQQFGPFLGTVKIFDGASIRFSSTSGVVNGGASALFDTNLSGDIATRNTGTVHLGALVGNGTLTGAGGAAGTATFSIGARNQNCIFGGRVNDANATDRKAALTKTGNATLTLTGNNSYTGATNVSAGTLEIGNNGTTGSITGTNLAVSANATLSFIPGSTQVQTVSGIVSGAGNVKKQGSGRTALNGVNTFTVSPVIEGGTLAINADSGLGNAANSVRFTAGTGALASDVAGLTTARAVSIDAGATGGFAALDATDTLEVTGTVSGDGSLAISGNGLVRLSGTNTYAGNTTVNSGVLDVGSASATSSGSVTVAAGTLAGSGSIAGAVSVASAGKLKPGAITTTSSAVGSLTVGSLNLAGGSTIYAEFASGSSYDKIVVNGNVGTTAASTATPVYVDLRAENSVAKWTALGTYSLIQYSGSFTGNANDLFKVTTESTQSGLAYNFDATGGVVTLTISGSAPSEWNLDSAGNWSSAGSWLNGIPNVRGSTAKFASVLTGAQVVTVDSAKTVGYIQFNNANQYTVAGPSPLTLDATTGNAGIDILLGSHVISAPLVLNDSLDISLVSSANTLTLSGNVTGSGGITNSTAGALVLSGTNSFSGNVTISTGSLTFNSGSLGSGSLNLSNASLVWGASNSLDISSRTVSMNGSSVTLNTNGNNVMLSHALGNGGAAGLVKVGEGTLTFAEDPSYAGSTTISGGVLQLGNGGSTGLVVGPIVDNAELQVNLQDATELSNVISGTGSFVHGGSGRLILRGANTFTGTTTISSSTGILELSDALNLQSSTLDYSSAGGSLDFGSITAATLGGLSGDKDLVLTDALPAAVTLSVGNNNSSTSYSGSISGTGALTKVGTGTLTLSGVNSFAGAATVTAGTLELATGSSISGTSLAVNGSGKMRIAGGILTGTTGALATGSAGLLVDDGSATFSGAFTAAGSNGNTASALIKVTGGSLTVPSITMGRTFETTSAEPAAGVADRNLYITGGSVHVTGDVAAGTASNQPNSTVTVRMDGGSLAVDGSLVVGLNNAGRWSILDVNGGVLTSTNSQTGIMLGGGWAGKSAFLVRSGVATAERIQLGQLALDGTGLIKLSGGELYVGAGGIVQGSTSPAFASEIRLVGGLLGAKAAWATSAPVNVTDSSVIKAASLTDVAQDITLSGVVSGLGNLQKSGLGNLTLSGTNTYNGTLTVAAGSLLVTGDSSGSGGNVNVESGASLGGAGNIGGSVSIESGAHQAITLAATAGAQVTRIITGSLSLATGSVIDLAAAASLADGTYVLATASGGIVGDIATTTVNYNGVSGAVSIDGNSLKLVVSSGQSGFLSWATTKGLTSGVNDGVGQDPDNDGVSNLLEFVLGGNPLASSSAILPSLSADGANFVFTFGRDDASESEVSLAFQYGSDLATWTTLVVGAEAAQSGAGVAVTENGSASDTITITVPKGNKASLFGRLRAVK